MRTFKKPLLALTGIACLLWGVSVLLFVTHWGRLPEEIMLFQKTEEGNAILREKSVLGGILATSGLAILINICLSKALFFRNRVLSLLILGGTALFSLFTLIAVGAIIAVN